MFVGHVGAALGLHRLDRRLSVGVLIGAALLLDFLLWCFILAGWERVIVPADYAHHHYLMYVFPYSHGLVETLVWAGCAAAITSIAFRSSGRARWAGGIIGAAVVSHWVLDAIVHVRGLPLMTDASPHIGLGLWAQPTAALLVEGSVTLAGAWFFLQGRISGRWTGLFWIVLGLVFLMTVAGETVSPAPTNVRVVAGASLVVNLAVVLACGRVGALALSEEKPR